MTVALPFAIVDVFADRPLTGNPLAVVLDADDLATDTMRDIAREFKQAETTFVLRPRDPGAARRLRSFTAAGEEVAGIGHNALGAWWWLAQRGEIAPGPTTQEVEQEVYDLDIRREGATLSVQLRQRRAQTIGCVEARSLADPLRLPQDRLVGPDARVVSTGAPHLLVEAADAASVDAAAPDSAALLPLLAAAGAEGLYLYAAQPSGAYARFFNPTVGLWEDSATGSAASPLAWTLNGGRDGRVLVEQGHAMGRPSRIELRVADGVVTLVGSAVLTAEGRLHL